MHGLKFHGRLGAQVSWMSQPQGVPVLHGLKFHGRLGAQVSWMSQPQGVPGKPGMESCLGLRAEQTFVGGWLARTYVSTVCMPPLVVREPPCACNCSGRSSLPRSAMPAHCCCGSAHRCRLQSSLLRATLSLLPIPSDGESG